MSESTSRRLNTILTLDAATCAVMGLLLIFAAGPVSALTQISAPLLFWAGLFLLPIAGFMALVARASQAPAWAVMFIVLGNILWVIASLVLPLSGAITPDAFGWIFLLAQAGVVALFAWLEWSMRPTVATVS